MKKQEVLSRINKARIGHKKWVSFAEGLIEGIPLDQDNVPIAPTDCEFGQWYYGEGRGLSDLPAYKKLEDPHDAIHHTYQRVFATLFRESKASMLSRLIGTAVEEENERKEEARALLPELKEHSATIIQLLDQLEKEVQALEQEDLETRLG